MRKDNVKKENASLIDVSEHGSERVNEYGNNVEYIPVELLIAFRDHPFKVTENKEMKELCKSIKEKGILSPILVRPLIGGNFEIISGHRRRYCAQKVGLQTVPCIVKEMDYDSAVFVMLESNLQRKNILPSEKAFSYKIRLEAIKRRGERTDLYCCRNNSIKKGLSSASVVGEAYNDSPRGVYRYIRLTELSPELLEATDTKKLSFGAAVEISYLTRKEQDMIEKVSSCFCKYPSLTQAKALREMAGTLSKEKIKALMDSTGKRDDIGIIRISKLKDFFPETFTCNEIETALIEILEKNKVCI